MAIIDVASYPQSREGEKSLLTALFNSIRANLGEKHLNDELLEVLRNDMLFDIYLKKYYELKEGGQILVNDENIPCNQSEAHAIQQLISKVKRRATADSFLPVAYRSLFTDEQIVRMDPLVIQYVRKLSLDQVKEIGVEFLCQIKDVQLIDALSKLDIDKIKTIGGEYLCQIQDAKIIEALSEMDIAKIEVIEGKFLCRIKNYQCIQFLLALDIEKIKAIGGRFLCQIEDYLRIVFLAKLGIEKIKEIGGEFLCQIEDYLRIVFLAEMDIDKIKAIGGEYLCQIQDSEIIKALSKMDIDKIKAIDKNILVALCNNVTLVVIVRIFQLPVTLIAAIDIKYLIQIKSSQIVSELPQLFDDNGMLLSKINLALIVWNGSINDFQRSINLQLKPSYKIEF